MLRQVEDFYYESDGADWRPAVMRAQHSWRSAASGDVRGFTLLFGPRDYQFSGPLNIIRGMNLVGSGGAGWYAGTRLVFDSGVDGIVVEAGTTAPEEYPGGGAWSILEKMAIISRAGSPTHGVTMPARAHLRDLYIAGFGGNGINIVASVGAGTNANNWMIDQCRIDGCGGHGIYIRGDNTNAGCAILADVSDNGGWGVLDESFLGNTYIACHAAANALGGYKCVGRNARSLFLNCYTEGVADSHIGAPSIVLGGFMGVIGDAAYMSAGGFVATFPNGVQGVNVADPSIQITAKLGGVNPRTALELTESESGHSYRFHYGYVRPGWWELVYHNLDGAVPLRFSTVNAPEGVGNLWFEAGYYIGVEGWRCRVWAGGAAPTTGNWNRGDRVLNTLPVAGGDAGWICIEGGSPGIWKTFGKIEA